MSRQYLNVPYAEKDQAKALGARFDGAVKRWFVPDGGDITLFSPWLPEGRTPASTAPTSHALTAAPVTSGALTTPAASQGISLSRLLASVGAVVAQAFDQGVWVLAEVVQVQMRGHVYLELSEREASGQPVAKARAMIWSATAARILPEFERATGVVLGAGIKLLLRARPVLHAQYGFSLEIEAIDADYTLGDLEARKRDIRERLQREGVWERNRQLSAPWDYRQVLVLAPEDAAGLGDFRKEADRLERFGLCQFSYLHSRFQGEGAARAMVSTLEAALQQWRAAAPPDAVVLIRGGGAVNDLAWLNDYDLARFICDLPIPVLTGLGHERDNTIPDEVAQQRFDTPSKVIAGIERHIVQRAQEAQALAQAVFAQAQQLTQQQRAQVQQLHNQTHNLAQQHLSGARQRSQQLRAQVQVAAMGQLHQAAQRSASLWQQVRASSAGHLSQARLQTTLLHQQSLQAASSYLGRARQASRAQWQLVSERAQIQVQQARQHSQALLREIAGQGPDKTLARGFAMVRDENNHPITSKALLHKRCALSKQIIIEWHDGSVNAQINGSDTQET